MPQARQRETDERIATLLTDEVNRNETFYVAEIVGEHPKYGLDREFVTSQNSPYCLKPADFEEGAVYELKDERTNVRTYFTIVYPDDGPLGDDVPFEVHVVDRGDDVDEDEILEIVDGEADGEMAAVRAQVHDLVDEATDPEALEAMAAMLEEGSDARDPGAVATVDLTTVPTSVRQNAQLFSKCFAAAFEKQTDHDAGIHLQAAALDAGVLYEQKRRQRGGGD